MTTLDILRAAKAAWPKLRSASSETRNAALNAMADGILAAEAQILEANALDLDAARTQISPVMLDRLRLSPERLRGKMCIRDSSTTTC